MDLVPKTSPSILLIQEEDVPIELQLIRKKLPPTMHIVKSKN